MEVIDFLKSVRRIRSLNRNPAISDEDIESLINQVDMVRNESRIHIQYLIADQHNIFLKDYLWFMKVKHGKIMDSLFTN